MYEQNNSFSVMNTGPQFAGYPCRSDSGCGFVGKTISIIRHHRMQCGSQTPEQDLYRQRTRRQLSATLDVWFKGQPDNTRQYVCHEPDCERQGWPMGAAGITVHYAMKHADTERGRRALVFADNNGLNTIASAGRTPVGNIVQHLPFDTPAQPPQEAQIPMTMSASAAY